MRKVVAAEYVSVDGVMQDPGGVGEIEQGGWTNPYFNVRSLHDLDRAAGVEGDPAQGRSSEGISEAEATAWAGHPDLRQRAHHWFFCTAAGERSTVALRVSF